MDNMKNELLKYIDSIVTELDKNNDITIKKLKGDEIKILTCKVSKIN